MSQDILVDESIKVWVLFNPSTPSTSIFPVAMVWKERLIKFKRLVFISSKRIGGAKMLNLVCASESANFELEYEDTHHLWKLKKVMPIE
jgi:hypothetical protein